MMSFRPETGSRYLDRPRLLAMLPEEPGFVVWLEAPYGHGKSVLASQWARALEGQGWRVIWLAADADDIRRTVSKGLDLPADSPWGALLETLWSSRTLLVLEDLENLEDHEELVPLLRDPRGLLLLASRGALQSSELPRLLTGGRLVHLRSNELAFTLEEVRALIADQGLAERLWHQSGGWPLPVHFAALTGRLPDGRQLLSGMNASLTEAQWQEVLLLAAVSDLPASAGTATTETLAGSGFVQVSEAGYRLHTLAAEIIISNHASDAATAVRAATDRLPLLLYGEALERLGDLRTLAGLLEQPQSHLSRLAPNTVLRWDRILPEPASQQRHVTAGMANTVLGRHTEAVSRIQQGLEAGGLEPAEELFALKHLVWSLAHTDHAAAMKMVERAERLFPQVDPELAGRFLNDASYVDVVVGDHAAAIAKLERAMTILPAASDYRTGCHINLALNRWDSAGDYDGRLAAQTGTLSDVWRLYPSDAPGQCRDIAMLYAWSGDWATARHYLQDALSGERASPVVAIEVRAALAAIDGDAGAFPELLSQARLWNSSHTVDLVAMYAIQTSPQEAEYFYSQVPEPSLAVAAFARAHSDREEALEMIDAALNEQEERAFRLYLLAARYCVSCSDADLEAFLDQTNARERLLPGHVPLSALPADRPELARHYAIEDVINSGWSDAIRLRLDELPDLRIDVLGKLRVQFAGRTLDLSERLLQVLILLLLRRSREEAAECIWPEANLRQQRNNYNVQLSTLRKALEPWGKSRFLTEDGLQHVTGDYLDLLDALAESNHPAMLNLYREPFAPGLNLNLLDEHRTWLQTRMIEQFQAAAEADGAAAGKYLTRILELDPLNEDVLYRLLEHLLQHGRQTQARRHYDEFASRLRLETGLEPTASTTSLMRQN